MGSWVSWAARAHRAADAIQDAVIALVILLAPLALGTPGRGPLLLMAVLIFFATAARCGYLPPAPKTWQGVRTALLLPMICFALTYLVFIRGSQSLFTSWMEGWRILLGMLLCWLIMGRPGTIQRAYLFIGALVAGMGIAVIRGFQEYAAESAIGNPDWRVFGGFSHPTMLAGYLAMAIIPAAWLMVRRLDRDRSVWWSLLVSLVAACFMLLAPRGITLALPATVALLGVCLFAMKTKRVELSQLPVALVVGLACAALLLTGARGGWIAFGAGGILFALLTAACAQRHGRALAATLAVVLAVMALALVATPIRMRLFTSFSAQHHSMAFRVLTWQGTVKMIEASPWTGWGAGVFQYVYPKFALGGYTQTAHQNYLQIAAENGLIGLALFLWLLVAFWVTAIKWFQRAADLEKKLLMAALMAGMLAFMVHSLLDWGWYNSAILFWFWALIGLTVMLGEQTEATITRGTWQSAWRAVSLRLAVLIALTSCVLWWVAYRGEQALQTGER